MVNDTLGKLFFDSDSEKELLKERKYFSTLDRVEIEVREWVIISVIFNTFWLFYYFKIYEKNRQETVV